VTTPSLDILVRARDEATAVINRVGSAGKNLGAGMKGVGDKMSSVGGAMTRGVTPAAIGMALAFKSAHDEMDTAVDKLRAGTGATGAELDTLTQSLKNVGAKSGASLSVIGATMAQVKQRTGATGAELEGLTLQVLKLAHVTGGDAAGSVQNLTRLFGDWSVKTKDQAGTLDQLFRLAQISGIAVDDLSGLMVQFGSPLRNLGVDLNFAAAMFARFEKEGVNTQTVMPGLKMALKNFAAAGKEPQKALMDTFDAIKNASSVAEANTLAFDTFGARAGPDLAAAIREGRFELDDYIAEMKGGTDTIAKAEKDTRDLSDKFGMLRNRIFAVIGPFGELGAVIFGGVAAVGPFLMGMGAMLPLFGHIGTAAKALWGALMANPFILIAAAVVVLAVIIFKNWEKIKGFLLAAWNAITNAASRFWKGLLRVLSFTPILAIIRGGVAVVVGIFKTWWTIVRAVVQAGMAVVKVTILPAIRLIASVWKNVWNGMKAVFSGVWNTLVGIARPVLNGIIGLVNGVISAINLLIKGYNLIPFHSDIAMIPKVPSLDTGGLVSRTGLAVVHRGETFSGVGRGRGMPGRVHVSIDRRHWVAQNEFETVYRGF